MLAKYFINSDYDSVLDIQHKLFAEVLSAKDNKLSANYLLFCEHNHTITIGKHGKQDNLLLDKQYLIDRGIQVYQIERGGDITYHGPGQLVIYPIFDLEYFNIGLRQYIYNLEEIVIQLLSTYNIVSGRMVGAAGVWIDSEILHHERKICAIGVKSSRFVTMHGLALNVNTDLNYFSMINPCGFLDKGVTSMQKELSRTIDLNEVMERMLFLFQKIFVHT